MSEIIPILKTHDPNHAEIVRNVLKREGIAASIEGENQAGFSGVFEISVVVPSDQADTARTILKELSAEQENSAEDASDEEQ